MVRETRVRSQRIPVAPTHVIKTSLFSGSATGNEPLCPPNLKSRKWRKVLVRLGSIIVPRWVAEVENVNEELQQYNTNKDKKLSNKKARKRLSTTEQKAEVVSGI